MKLPKNILVAVAANMLMAYPAIAEQVPQWELGAGLAYIDLPQYRGSNQRQVYFLPVPYAVYNGDFLKIDHERTRGLFLEAGAAELDVSVNGSVPVRDNQARQGMPNLDPAFEIGPALNIFLHKRESGNVQLELRLPLRFAVATDFSYLHDIGLMFQPQLNLDVHDVLGQSGWDLGMAAGAIYSDRRYNQYFYSVAPGFARPDRPAYTAGGGYSGSQLTVSLAKRFPGYWFGGFVKWDMLRGAVFEQSPLVKQSDSATVGIAISWILAESPNRVEVGK
jgi:outer membrane scaffolding protein for murein synthesis (MipA/OmpV family)